MDEEAQEQQQQQYEHEQQEEERQPSAVESIVSSSRSATTTRTAAAAAASPASQEDEKPVRLEEEKASAAASAATTAVAAPAAAASAAERSTLSKVASAAAVVGELSSEARCRSRESNWRSGCGARGRDPRRCQSRLKDLIGKHELKNKQLEQREGHLQQRLQMLECSVPAVMVWKAWSTTGTSRGQGVTSAKALQKLVEEAAALAATGCRTTPSRHYDCRVREIEAQRKEAHRRAEEARCLWLEREAALQGQRARVELARQQQAERQKRMERLADEALKLEKEAAKTGECDADGEKRRPEVVESAASLGAGDLECLERLESLAEAESCMRRRIAELEVKEEAYMRVLERTNDLRDAANVGHGDGDSDEQQLRKAQDEADAANRQLETSRDELNSVRTRHKEAQVAVESVDTAAGRDDDLATVRDWATQPSPLDAPQSKESWTCVEMATKDVDATVSCASCCVGHYRSEANKSVLVRAETRDKPVQAGSAFGERCSEADKSVLARSETRDKPCQAGAILADKSEATLPVGLPNFACGFTCGRSPNADEEEEGEFATCCPPDFVCNDVVDSATGMTGPTADVEMNWKNKNPLGSCADSRGLSGSKLVESEQSMRHGKMKTPRSEVETCLSIVSDIRKKISGTSKYPLVSEDFEDLNSIISSVLQSDSYTLQKVEKEINEEILSKEGEQSKISLRKSEKVQTNDKISVSTINAKEKKSIHEVASSKSTLNKSESKRDEKSVKSILKPKTLSSAEDRKSILTQPSRSQNQNLVKESDSKKTEKSTGKSKASSINLDNKSPKTVKSDKKSLIESTSKKSVMESNEIKSVKSRQKSKTLSIDGVGKNIGQLTQKSANKSRENGIKRSSKPDIKSKASPFKEDNKSIEESSDIKIVDYIRESESKKSTKSDIKSKVMSFKESNKSVDQQSAVKIGDKIGESESKKSTKSDIKSKASSFEEDNNRVSQQSDVKSVDEIRETESKKSMKSDIKSKVSSFVEDNNTVDQQSDVKSVNKIRETESKKSIKIDVKSKTSSFKEGSVATQCWSSIGRQSAVKSVRSIEPSQLSGSAIEATENLPARVSETDEALGAATGEVVESPADRGALEGSPPTAMETAASSRTAGPEAEVRSIGSSVTDSEYLECCCDHSKLIGAVDLSAEKEPEAQQQQQQQEQQQEQESGGLGPSEKEEVPKDKLDLSVSETTDKRTAMGPLPGEGDGRRGRHLIDKTDDDLCICAPPARIATEWQLQEEAARAPGLSKRSCGCPFERQAQRGQRPRRHRHPRPRTGRGDLHQRQRARRRLAICPCSERQRLPDVLQASGQKPSEERATGVGRCYRCGSPLRRDSTKARGDDDELQETVDLRAECDGDTCSRREDCLNTEVPGSLTTREQGVLAKLPKPTTSSSNKSSSSKRKRPKKRRTLELLFDGASRKVARILEAISSDKLGLSYNAKSPRVGSSCTCLREPCTCADSD